MRDILGWVSATEESVLLATGVANAGYFFRRARGTSAARRRTALVLGALFAGTAALALAQLHGGLDEAPGGVALRVPLVVANVAALPLVVIGRGR